LKKTGAMANNIMVQMREGSSFVVHFGSSSVGKILASGLLSEQELDGEQIKVFASQRKDTR
jgi:hypothetical protein